MRWPYVMTAISAFGLGAVALVHLATRDGVAEHRRGADASAPAGGAAEPAVAGRNLAAPDQGARTAVAGGAGVAPAPASAPATVPVAAPIAERRPEPDVPVEERDRERIERRRKAGYVSQSPRAHELAHAKRPSRARRHLPEEQE